MCPERDKEIKVVDADYFSFWRTTYSLQEEYEDKIIIIFIQGRVYKYISILFGRVKVSYMCVYTQCDPV